MVVSVIALIIPIDAYANICALYCMLAYSIMPHAPMSIPIVIGSLLRICMPISSIPIPTMPKHSTMKCANVLIRDIHNHQMFTFL